jgi:hypothetical protein
MIARCTNPNHRSYREYGGAGITVCEQWRTFANFLSDMGEKPDGRSLDRIDNDGNYSPDNCRWATVHEQARNKSNNTFLTHNGMTMTIAGWAETLGIPQSTISWRLNRGHPIARVLRQGK